MALKDPRGTERANKLLSYDGAVVKIKLSVGMLCRDRQRKYFQVKPKNDKLKLNWHDSRDQWKSANNKSLSFIWITDWSFFPVWKWFLCQGDLFYAENSLIMR